MKKSRKLTKTEKRKVRPLPSCKFSRCNINNFLELISILKDFENQDTLVREEKADMEKNLSLKL